MGDFSLAGSALFAGVEKEELGPLLQKVGARERSFQRGETLLTAGERARSMGLVLAGRVTVEHHDFWGSRSVLDSLGPGKVFAEAYALLPEEPLQVSVTGAEAGRVLSYLSFEAARNGSREFTIPFTRQQLADYLEVDRSALSHELGNMAREGLLRTRRSHFALLEQDGRE